MTDDRDDLWLDARERGESVEHIAAERRGPYAQLEKRIAELPAAERAPDGWQGRVLAHVRSPNPMAMGTSPPVPAPDIPAKKQRGTWFVVAGAVAAAAIVMIILKLRPSGQDVSIAYVPTGGKMLGPEDEVHKTDLIVVRAHDDRVTAIRVYADHGKQIGHCERCDVDEAIRVPLETVTSNVTVVVFEGCTPPPTVDEATDRAAATKQGCDVRVPATRAVR